MKNKISPFIASTSIALLLASLAWLAPLGSVQAASDTARGGASDLMAVKPVVATRSDAHSKTGSACSSCLTVPVTLKLEQGKSVAPITVAGQKHDCARCETKTQTVGHGKMRETLVNHHCQNQAVMTCCASPSGHSPSLDHN